ncbi:MAG: stage II sporulation protein P [Bacillus sp. (in: Bacteria)]|nr:stage II sporulation protein P [Bacillus sp. (in: firmicutes)]MCM1426938.1 stage II sporulation protein P [Eubacterium sp.]
MKKGRLSIRWNNEIHIGRGILRIALLILCLMALGAMLKEFYDTMESQERETDGGLLAWTQQTMINIWMPGTTVWQNKTRQNEYNPLEYLVLENFPVLLYGMEEEKYSPGALQESSYEELLLLEGSDEDRKGIDEESLEYGEDAIHLDKSLEEAFLAENGLVSENQAAGGYGEETRDDGMEAGNGVETAFYEVEEPLYRYQWENLQDYEELVKAFYAVDSTTTAGAELLNTKKLLEKDMMMQGKNDEPQILIYHTHSQEGFADSIPGDASTTIVGAGEKLAQILHDKYGYNVIHHTASYDEKVRDDAYANALPGIEEVLAENPSVEVVIDLHRDEMPEGRRLVVDMQGRATAQFMFFNGLSRTAKRGIIESLENPYLDENLAFSFQMQTAANEYYPGITRRIYLKAYRYNMHLRPKSLLIELGAQNNTVEEIMNAVEPLAHVIHLVLAGEEPDRD